MFSFNFNKAAETKKEEDTSLKLNKDKQGIVRIVDASSAITPKKYNEQGGEPLVLETDEAILDGPLTTRQAMS